MKSTLVLLMGIVGLGMASPVVAAPQTPAKVDYAGFVEVSKEAGVYRQQRLVDLDSFLKMASEKDTLILDTRSESAYARKHLKNAVHLNFSEFTQTKLKKLIPSPSTRILIYCNNNFEQDAQNFPAKRVELALNIPTFINLYGYGYRNIYELSSLVKVDDPRLVFEGTEISSLP